jgi:uncharacterized protein (TIGR02266 family)
MTPRLKPTHEGIRFERPRAGAERRVSERLLVAFDVDCTSGDTFLFASARNLSALGIFLQTPEPRPPGTHLSLAFAVPPGGERLEVEGVVRWINPYRPEDPDNLNPGMGVELIRLTDAQREFIVDQVKLLAVLAEEDVPRGGAAREPDPDAGDPERDPSRS